MIEEIEIAGEKRYGRCDENKSGFGARYEISRLFKTMPPFVRIPGFQNRVKRLYKSTCWSGQKCLLSGGGNTPGRDASLVEEGKETGTASGHGGKQSAGFI